MRAAARGIAAALVFAAGCAANRSVAYHQEPYAPYAGELPAASGPARLHFLRHLPHVELVYTAWQDKFGAIDATPENNPRVPMPEMPMAYQNRVEWGFIRHDEVIQVPFGSMFAAKISGALRRMYGGEMEPGGDLISLERFEPSLHEHRIAAAVDYARFFEHPINHITLDIGLRLYVYPAGSAELQEIEHKILTRRVKLGGPFASAEDFLAELDRLLDEELNRAVRAFARELPVHAPVKPLSELEERARALEAEAAGRSEKAEDAGAVNTD